MNSNSQGPYLSLKVEGETGDRFRLLSLAPGNYDDPIEITLTTALVAPSTSVVYKRTAEYLQEISAHLSQLDQIRLVVKTICDMVKPSIEVMLFAAEATPTREIFCEDTNHTYLWNSVKHMFSTSTIANLAPLPRDASDAIDALLGYIEHVDGIPRLEYSAISYTWGTKISLNTVTVDGYEQKITENLEVALRHLRQMQRRRTMWIDALCINQEDMSERNHQIQLMSSIYSMAHETIVWLGPSADGSDWVMDSMMLGEVEDKDTVTFTYRVGQLMARPWWTRVWVIQEVAFSRAVILCCGCRSVSLRTFTDRFEQFDRRFGKELDFVPDHAYDFLESCFQFCTNLEPIGLLRSYVSISGGTPSMIIPAEMAVRVCTSAIKRVWLSSSWSLHGHAFFAEHTGLQNFYPALHHTTSNFEATDPRDHIYALLSMSEFPDHQIVADYHKSTAEVFAEAMAVHITEDLEEAYTRWPLSLGRVLIADLPSWVPNFDYRITHGIGPGQDGEPWWNGSDPGELCPDSEVTKTAMHDRYHGDRTRRLNPRYAYFSEDFRTLYTVGSSMGTITSTARIPHSERAPGVNGSIPLLETEAFLRETGLPEMQALIAFLGVPGKLFEAGPWIEALSDEAGVGNVWSEIRDRIAGWTLFLTDTGYIGRSFNGVKEGDILAGLFGIKLPFILRPERGNHTMVNVAHVADHELSSPWRDQPCSYIRSKQVSTYVERIFTII
jgi:hypothetical protein